jgi:nucleoside-diphosphate-sugar epimerase
LIRKRLGWEPSISLTDGMKKTFHWVDEQVRAAQ